jgi:hypothetical protein
VGADTKELQLQLREALLDVQRCALNQKKEAVAKKVEKAIKRVAEGTGLLQRDVSKEPALVPGPSLQLTSDAEEECMKAAEESVERMPREEGEGGAQVHLLPGSLQLYTDTEEEALAAAARRRKEADIRVRVPALPGDFLASVCRQVLAFIPADGSSKQFKFEGPGRVGDMDKKTVDLLLQLLQQLRDMQRNAQQLSGKVLRKQAADAAGGGAGKGEKEKKEKAIGGAEAKKKEGDVEELFVYFNFCGKQGRLQKVYDVLRNVMKYEKLVRQVELVEKEVLEQKTMTAVELANFVHSYLAAAHETKKHGRRKTHGDNRRAGNKQGAKSSNPNRQSGS